MPAGKTVLKWVLFAVGMVVVVVGAALFGVGEPAKECVAPEGTGGSTWTCTQEENRCACKEYDANGNLIDTAIISPQKTFKSPLLIVGGILLNVGIVTSFGACAWILQRDNDGGAF